MRLIESVTKMSLTSIVRQNATNFFIDCKNRKTV